MEIIEAYIHVDLLSQSSDAPKLFRSDLNKFHLYYNKDTGIAEAIKVISKSIASALGTPGLPSLRDLKKVNLSVIRIYRPRTDWVALEIELFKEKEKKKNHGERSPAVNSDDEQDA